MVVTACSGSPAAAGNGAAPNGSLGSYRLIPVASRHLAPQSAGDTLDGQPLGNSLVGRVLVVNFWASWCAPCRAEAGALQAAFHNTRAWPTTFIGVNEKDSRSAARAFAQEHQTPYPSVFDPDGTEAAQWPAATGLPYTFLVDRKGRIALQIIGGTTTAQLTGAIEALADEPG